MVDKINPAQAAGIYQNMQGMGQAARVTGGDQVSFGNLVKKAAVNSIDTMRAGEKASADAVIGKADLTDVVQAVSAAEVTLQTVVAVRDRMINAYQEIMRMPI